jgi:uncharacterized protein (TIGR03546 family)
VHGDKSSRGDSLPLDFHSRPVENSYIVFTILKIVQSLVKALNSEATPNQVAAGFVLGAARGLTPLVSLHNLIVVAAIALFRVTVPGAILGWLVTIPLGFLLDPVFDAVGRVLLIDADGLTPLWTTVTNTPVLSLANLNNTIVLGSLVTWAAVGLPLFVVARVGIVQYRRHVYPRVATWRVFRVLKASKAYNAYRMFRP